MFELRPFIDGHWEDGASIAEAEDKFTGATIGKIHTASQDQVRRATRAVAAAQESTRLTPYERYTILARASALVAERREAFVDSIMTDTGFPASDARTEVDRARETLLLSGEEAKRLTGHTVPIDAAPSAPDRIAFTIRRPVGVVAAITPFNSPLNTVLHKVAPAFAAGNGFVLKPSLYTSLTADLLLRLLLDAGVPEGLMSVLYGEGADVGQWLLEDEVPAYYAFTGSTSVGLRIRQTIGVRRAQLELGSLASTVVCADADLATAARLCANAGFRKAGQVCTSVQRLYVHESVVADFAARLATELDQRQVGDPRDPATVVGPVISQRDAERVSGWVDEAVSQGARITYGGGRDDRVVRPTVLADVRDDMKVFATEVFGPVASLRPFTDLDDALAGVNATPYGLAAGIFTASIDSALRAAQQLRVGTVHINETSSARVDLMPFGGVKASGEGHEGPAYAIRDMTEERLITMGRP
jgi:succinate-semialdehyde dehydrogenase/glutarate-semialdehyde dehydrogenase